MTHRTPNPNAATAAPAPARRGPNPGTRERAHLSQPPLDDLAQRGATPGAIEYASWLRLLRPRHG